jgi:hypothetical protein
MPFRRKNPAPPVASGRAFAATVLAVLTQAGHPVRPSSHYNGPGIYVVPDNDRVVVCSSDVSFPMERAEAYARTINAQFQRVHPSAHGLATARRGGNGLGLSVEVQVPNNTVAMALHKNFVG